MTKKNWLAIDNQTGFSIDSLKSEQPLKPSAFFPPFNIYRYADYQTPAETADEAYEQVLKKAGTIRRDKTERRIVDEVRNGTAKYKGTLGKPGFIDSPADADGWPTYPYFPAVIDEDHDGMDDSWELSRGLDPGNADDRNKILKGGYTALEVYLNYLMGER